MATHFRMEHTLDWEDCEACKWRESEIGYWSPCPSHKPRAFSKAQLDYIEEREKECADAGCDDNGHKHD